ncbi:hypothetical protein KJA17_00980 [Patescibacteria group bacterium]|nr:hypothetical protein [Patescibacteria group bacterium]
MKKEIKIIIIVVIVVAAALAFLVLLGKYAPLGEEEKSEVSQQQPTPSQEYYPDNLLEGVVKEIDLEERNLKLEVRTSLIKTAEKNVMEKIIKFTEDTEWAVYNTATEEESPFEFSEIRVDNSIVVVTVESTFDKINDFEEFAATKITKMITE